MILTFLYNRNIIESMSIVILAIFSQISLLFGVLTTRKKKTPRISYIGFRTIATRIYFIKSMFRNVFFVKFSNTSWYIILPIEMYRMYKPYMAGTFERIVMFVIFVFWTKVRYTDRNVTVNVTAVILSYRINRRPKRRDV